MDKKLIALILLGINFTNVFCDLTCYVCDDCPDLTLRDIRFLTPCNGRTALNRMDAMPNATLDFNTFPRTQSKFSLSDLILPPGDDGQSNSDFMCFKVVNEVNGTEIVNRGCIKRVGQLNETCDLINKILDLSVNDTTITNTTECRICSSNQCNQGDALKYCFWILIGALLIVRSV